ncbi:hypothetical protein ABLO27_17795 [Roseibium sp. SCPC15]|uniref:hypothetical protein n=1 Tax=Roseibium sp. SCP15 TaxID=3141376 RepID=UPI0033384C70
MSRKKVILLDQAQLGTILKYGGFAALDAIVARGDKFLYVHQSFTGDEDLKKINQAQRKAFEAWLKEKRYQGKVLYAGRVNRASREEQKRYDPLGKAGTQGNNNELWDMGARKFMLENNDLYDFEVISRDDDFLDNRVGKDHPLKKVPFERLSMKSALSWLMTHPDVELSEVQFNELRTGVLAGNYGASHNLENHSYLVPDSYEAAEKIKEEARRASKLEERQKRKTNRKRAANKARKLFDAGTPVIITAATAAALHELISREAEESGNSYLEAAQTLGIEFTREKLTDLAAEAGIDLAVTFTPIGPVKKAWDVLGNVDDIVAVTQLYGAAYPDNETIQQMAGIADAVEGTAIFETYVEGRDALTGAVGGAIDWVFGASADEDEQAKALGDLRELVEIGGDAAGDAFKAGATQEQVADVLTSALQARAAALVTSGKPLAEEQAPLSAPVPTADQLSPETVLPGDGTVPASAVPTLPGAQPILPSSLESGLEPALEPGLDPASGQATTPAASAPIPDRAGGSGPDEDGADSDRFLRKTSYRTFRKIGRTPEEEQQGHDELWEEFEQGYLEMNGHEQAAELLAARRFSRRWALSDYAEDADGLMLKYPLERVYPNIEEIGYSYVDEDVNAALSHQGIRAKKWYLTPNDKTGGDWEQGWMDEDGYGPRMTLAYDDEAGQRHRLSDSYQVNARGAAIKLKQKQLKAERMKAGQTAPGPASGPRVDIPKKAPVPLQAPTTAQTPVSKPKPDIRPTV